MPALVLLALAVIAPGASRVATPLVGSVVNSDGTPAPGVSILASGGTWAPNDPPILLGRTTTDDRGEFLLDLADDPAATEHPTIWAIRPGARLARAAIGAEVPAAPFRLVLGPPGGASVAVVAPDGRPVEGARVIPIAVEDAAVPGVIGVVAAATSDADGRAMLPGFFPEDLQGVDVEAPGFGVQRRCFREADGGSTVDEKRVSLLETGRVSGRVNAEGPGAAAGLSVRVTTVLDDRAESVVCVAETTTDEAGRFELAEVASGKVTARVRPRAGSADLQARVGRRNLRGGQAIDFAISLSRGVRIHGFVRQEREAHPVEGAVLCLLPAGSFEPAPVRTDVEGRFEAFVPAGPVTYRMLRVPAPFLGPPSFAVPRPVVVPDGIAAYEMPPIALPSGGEVRGSVVDADGRPVAGASVEASWTWFDGRTRAPRSVSTTTRDDGSFAVGPVDPTAELKLAASSGAGVSRPASARVGDPAPVRLTLEPGGAAALSGRVVDPDGKPIAGASVRVRWPGSSPGRIELRSDPEGRFLSPRLPLDGRVYRAVATAEGFRPGRTPEIRPSQAGSTAFPDLVLSRMSHGVVLEGRAVDRSGRPIAGVVVWTWGEGPGCRRATSDQAGKFRLTDVAAGPGFLFADREGFRFEGRTILAGAGNHDGDLVLTRSDEPPSLVMATRPANPGHRAVARAAIAPLVETVLVLGDAATRLRVLEVFAGIDPARALAMIRDGAVKDPWVVDHLRCVAARRLLEWDPGRASEAIAAIEDPETRMLGALSACSSLPVGDLVRRSAWLERAEADADAIRDPSARVIALADVAGHWLDLGDEDRASRLLIEARPHAEALPGVAKGARARGVFAECLARVDASQGLALIDGLMDPVAADRHRVRIARVLASRDPEGAEKVLAKIRDQRSLVADIPSLCHAMARTDPARARGWIARIARGGELCLPPFALGLMALAAADSDKAAASAWLREAYDQLDAVSSPGVHDPAVLAAALLPVAEKIDPALVPEFFWKAVAIRGPRPSGHHRADATLIPLLARYNRSAAQVLFVPLAARMRDGTTDDPCSIVVAGATLDPDLARRLIAELPEAPPGAARQLRREASLALATSLVDLAAPSRDDLAGLLRLWVGGRTHER